MSVRTLNQFKRHRISSTHRVEITAGSTKTAFATERDEFKFTTIRAFINGIALGRIATFKHSMNIIKDSGTNINTAVDYFIEVIHENILQNVHGNIISYWETKRNPQNTPPQD